MIHGPLLLLLLAQPKPLAIADITLHQFDGGPSVPAAQAFLPGDTVFLTFQIAGYRKTEDEKIRLSYQVEAFDEKNVPLVAAMRDKISAELAPEDKNWQPKVHQDFLIPPWADTGTYRIAIQVKDEIAGTDARQERQFRVRGRQVEPSDTLVARNFRFLRTEEDTEPLTVAAYRPGSAIFARFEITGYKLGEKNRLDVGYGISVLRPTGEVMYSEPEAASEKDQSFYPKRWVYGGLSLKLDPDIRPGEYTVVLVLRDAIGKQQTESRHVFRVEE